MNSGDNKMFCAVSSAVLYFKSPVCDTREELKDKETDGHKEKLRDNRVIGELCSLGSERERVSADMKKRSRNK